MTAAALTVGQEVRVFDVNHHRRRPDLGGWPGVVTKVGRKLADITYHCTTETFRMDTCRVNDEYGHRWYRTVAQAELDQRRGAAVAALGRRGVRLDPNCDLSLEEVEAMAAALDRAAPLSP